MTGRQGRRRRKLLDDLKERRGYSHLKEDALDRTMWRARFGGGFGPVIRQTAKRINVRCFVVITLHQNISTLPHFQTSLSCHFVLNIVRKIRADT